MADTRVCPVCGSSNGRDVESCPRCGRDLSAVLPVRPADTPSRSRAGLGLLVVGALVISAVGVGLHLNRSVPEPLGESWARSDYLEYRLDQINSGHAEPSEVESLLTTSVHDCWAPPEEIGGGLVGSDLPGVVGDVTNNHTSSVSLLMEVWHVQRDGTADPDRSLIEVSRLDPGSTWTWIAAPPWTWREEPPDTMTCHVGTLVAVEIAPTGAPTATTLRRPSEVRVMVLNAVGTADVAEAVAGRFAALDYNITTPNDGAGLLAALGYGPAVAGSGNHPPNHSVVLYRSTFGGEALRIGAEIPDAAFKGTSKLTGTDILVVLGHSYEG